MAFERGIVPENWRFIVIVPLYKGKWEMIKSMNYRVIGWKIYTEI